MWRFDRKHSIIGSWRLKLISVCQEVLKMSLALSEPQEMVALQSNIHPTSNMQHHITSKWKERKKLLILYPAQPVENQRDHLPTKNPIELEG